MEDRDRENMRNDFNSLIKKLNESGSFEDKEAFIEWIESCANYMYSAGQQIIQTAELYSDNNVWNRKRAEEMNRRRTERHNEAIRKTIAFNKRLIKMAGMGRDFFDLNLNNRGKKNYLNNTEAYKTEKDLSSEQRNDLGRFFWDTCGLVSGLDNQDLRGFNKIAEEVQRKREHQRHYGSKNTSDLVGRVDRVVDDFKRIDDFGR